MKNQTMETINKYWEITSGIKHWKSKQGENQAAFCMSYFRTLPCVPLAINLRIQVTELCVVVIYISVLNLNYVINYTNYWDVDLSSF
jgi:hypothetical protein